MKTLVYIACSLDGNIAKIDGNIDWLTSIPNPENMDYGFNEFMNSVDAILMGRKTFETVLQFNEWPYRKPVFVLTSSPKIIPVKLREFAEVITGTPHEILTQLEDKKFRRIYIDGGKSIQYFLNSNLIDELIITTIAKIIGDGIKLFENIKVEEEFEILKAEILNSIMVKIYYKKRNRTTSST